MSNETVYLKDKGYIFIHRMGDGKYLSIVEVDHIAKTINIIVHDSYILKINGMD